MKKSILLFVLILLLAVVPLIVFSQTEITYPSLPGVVSPQEFLREAETQEEILPLFINYIFHLFLVASVAVALGVILYGGFLHITSAGDPEKRKSAKSWILSAMHGALIIFASYALLFTLDSQLVLFQQRDLDDPDRMDRLDLDWEIKNIYFQIPFGLLVEDAILNETAQNKLYDVLDATYEAEDSADAIEEGSKQLLALVESCPEGDPCYDEGPIDSPPIDVDEREKPDRFDGFRIDTPWWDLDDDDDDDFIDSPWWDLDDDDDDFIDSPWWDRDDDDDDFIDTPWWDRDDDDDDDFIDSPWWDRDDDDDDFTDPPWWDLDDYDDDFTDPPWRENETEAPSSPSSDFVGEEGYLLEPGVEYTITSELGEWRGSGGIWDHHQGVDITAAGNVSILSSHGGEVVSVLSLDSSRGNTVVVLHTDEDGNNYLILYQHLDSYTVETGDFIDAGLSIGKMGSTGAGGHHLHYEVRKISEEEADQAREGNISLGAGEAVDPFKEGFLDRDLLNAPTLLGKSLSSLFASFSELFKVGYISAADYIIDMPDIDDWLDGDDDTEDIQEDSANCSWHVPHNKPEGSTLSHVGKCPGDRPGTKECYCGGAAGTDPSEEDLTKDPEDLTKDPGCKLSSTNLRDEGYEVTSDFSRCGVSAEDRDSYITQGIHCWCPTEIDDEIFEEWCTDQGGTVKEECGEGEIPIETGPDGRVCCLPEELTLECPDGMVRMSDEECPQEAIEHYECQTIEEGGMAICCCSEDMIEETTCEMVFGGGWEEVAAGRGECVDGLHDYAQCEFWEKEAGEVHVQLCCCTREEEEAESEDEACEESFGPGWHYQQDGECSEDLWLKCCSSTTFQGRTICCCPPEEEEFCSNDHCTATTASECAEGYEETDRITKNGETILCCCPVCPPCPIINPPIQAKITEIDGYMSQLSQNLAALLETKEPIKEDLYQLYKAVMIKSLGYRQVFGYNSLLLERRYYDREEVVIETDNEKTEIGPYSWDWSQWIGNTLYRVEVDGQVIEENDPTTFYLRRPEANKLIEDALRLAKEAKEEGIQDVEIDREIKKTSSSTTMERILFSMKRFIERLEIKEASAESSMEKLERCLKDHGIDDPGNLSPEEFAEYLDICKIETDDPTLPDWTEVDVKTPADYLEGGMEIPVGEVFDLTWDHLIELLDTIDDYIEEGRKLIEQQAYMNSLASPCECPCQGDGEGSEGIICGECVLTCDLDAIRQAHEDVLETREEMREIAAHIELLTYGHFNTPTEDICDSLNADIRDEEEKTLCQGGGSKLITKQELITRKLNYSRFEFDECATIPDHLEDVLEGRKAGKMPLFGPLAEERDLPRYTKTKVDGVSVNTSKFNWFCFVDSRFKD